MIQYDVENGMILDGYWTDKEAEPKKDESVIYCKKEYEDDEEEDEA